MTLNELTKSNLKGFWRMQCKTQGRRPRKTLLPPQVRPVYDAHEDEAQSTLQRRRNKFRRHTKQVQEICSIRRYKWTEYNSKQSRLLAISFLLLPLPLLILCLLFFLGFFLIPQDCLILVAYKFIQVQPSTGEGGINIVRQMFQA